MKRLIGIIALVTTLCLSFFIIGCSPSNGSADNAITVTASASAEVTPDKASLTLVVEAGGNTEEEANKAAQNRADEMVARLQAAGAASSDITTEIGNFEPSYGYAQVEEVVDNGYYDWDGNWVENYETYYYDYDEQILSYETFIVIKADGVNASEVPAVLKGSVDNGLVRVEALEFYVSDREAAYKQALAAAIDAAHAKAETMASASKVYVGGVVNMVENSEAASLVLVQTQDASKLHVKDKETLEVAPHAIIVEAAVTVSYAIS